MIEGNEYAPSIPETLAEMARALRDRLCDWGNEDVGAKCARDAIKIIAEYLNALPEKDRTRFIRRNGNCG